VDGYAFLAGGHTHRQWTRQVGGPTYVNPGAVMSSPPEYAIVEGTSIEFRHCAS
jgi:predicted phosphodiesterase